MNLKNNEITIGEIVSNPEAKALLKKEFPEVVNPMMLKFARNMTLGSVLALAKGRYSEEKILRALSELKSI